MKMGNVVSIGILLCSVGSINSNVDKARKKKRRPRFRSLALLFYSIFHGKIFLRTPQMWISSLTRPSPPKALVLLQFLPRSILSRVWWRRCISQHRVRDWLEGYLGSAWHLLRKECRRMTSASRRERTHGYWRSYRQGLGSMIVGLIPKRRDICSLNRCVAPGNISRA
jgi:hypothetical protein